MDLPATFKIEKEDPRPIYEQLTAHIVALCRQGILLPGDRLPPERELAAQLSISRGTVKKAVEILKFRGYLESLQGSGNYVASSLGHSEADGDQTERVRSICERAFAELQALHMPASRLFPLLHEYVDRAEQRLTRVRLALIDCAPETLHCCHSQLEGLGHLNIETFILKDLEQDHDGSLRSGIADCDVIFTTNTHCETVLELLPACANRLRSFALAVAPSTIVRLATLSHDSKIATVCQSQRFHEIINRTLETISPSFRCHDRLLESAEYPYVEGIPEDVNVLVLYASSPLLSDARCSGMLEEFRERGGRVVEFTYEMDSGSRMFIQMVVGDLYRKKTLGEPVAPASP